MNHRFTTEEKTFANEHVAGGREILEKEQDLGRKTTCVNVATTVLVSEAGATSLSVLILISLMFLAGGKGENGVLMLTQVVTAFVAHGIGLVAVWKSMRGILLFAVTLNLLEVILNVTRLCLILNSGKLLIAVLLIQLV